MMDYLRKRCRTSQCFTLMQDFRTQHHTAMLSCSITCVVWTLNCLISCATWLDHLIHCVDSNFRAAITTSEMLAVTLNFLFNQMRNDCVVAGPSVSNIVAETSAAIIQEFKDFHNPFHGSQMESYWRAVPLLIMKGLVSVSCNLSPPEP